jgi:plasmid stabilization system protein ParE
MELRFEPDAGEELEEATAYFARQSAGTGERFLSDMARTRELLLQFPGAGPPVRGNFRRILLRVFPYQLIYRVEGEVVRIYAVAHLKRRPGYWRKRLGQSRRG